VSDVQSVYDSFQVCPICCSEKTVLIVENEFDDFSEALVAVAQFHHCNNCSYDWDFEELNSWVSY